MVGLLLRLLTYMRWRLAKARFRWDKRRRHQKTLVARMLFRARFSTNRILDRRSLPLGPEHEALYETIQRWHYGRTGRTSAIRRQSSVNERIQWLMLFDRDPRKERLSDKLQLKEAVATTLGTEFAVPVLQVAERFDDLDLTRLPDRFVIKANHDSGSVEVVRDRDVWDVAASRSRFTNALSRVHGQDTGEWWYESVQPKVFVEELLEEGDGSPIADFKFHCSDGRVRFAQHLRFDGQSQCETVLDRSGEWIPVQLNNRLQLAEPDVRPRAWDEMVRIAEELARGFAYVRVDCYAVNQRVYVGEMTFAPRAAGFRSSGERVLGPMLFPELPS